MKNAFRSLSIGLFLAAAIAHGAETLAWKAIRTVYIDPMPYDLDQHIRAEIFKQLRGRIAIVLNPDGADAVLVGTCEHKNNWTDVLTGRWANLTDNTAASVALLDKERKQVLWAGEAGDRSIWLGSLKCGGPRKVADRLVGQLRRDLALEK